MSIQIENESSPPDERWTIAHDELYKTCVAGLIVAMVRVVWEQVLGIEDKSFFALLDLFIFITLIFNTFPFGPEYGVASELDPETQKSSQAYLARLGVNFWVIILTFLLPAFLPRHIGKQITIYISLLNGTRITMHTAKCFFALHLEKVRQDAEEGQERMSNIIGEKIENGELLKASIATIILSLFQLILNMIGVDGTILALAIYLIIFAIFSILPIGFHLTPRYPVEDRRSARIARIMVNFYIVWCTLFYWVTWPDLQVRHTDIDASVLQQPERFIEKMAEQVLTIQIILVLKSHFIVFNFVQLWVNIGKLVIRLLAV